MEISERYLYNPKYFDMLVSSAGQLSGNERRKRIIEIAQKNIWLAARCIHTSVNIDDYVTDWIIRRAMLVYSKFHDLHAIASLLELREYGELSVMLDILVNNKGYNDLHKDIFALIDNDERSISKAFAVFSQYIDRELAAKLFACLSDLGYAMDSVAYNALLANIDNPNEIKTLIKQMSISGVEADAETYFHLISKAKTFEEALGYFDSFKTIVDYPNSEDMVSSTYNTMIRMARNYQDIIDLKNDYYYHYPDKNSILFISLAIYTRSIEISSTYVEAKSYFEDFKEKQIPHFYTQRYLKGKNDLSSKQKKSIVNIVDTFVKRITNEKLDFDEVKEILSWILKQYSGYKMTRIRMSLDNIYYFVSKNIKEFNDFLRGKELINIFLNSGFWVNQECFTEMLLLANNQEDVDYVVGNADIATMNPKNVLRVLQSCNDTIFYYVLEKYQNKEYPFNNILYNAIIKRTPFKKAFDLIDEMIVKGMNLDKFTIQPLLRKWTNIKELSKVMQLATSYSISADERSAQAIARQANNINLSTELIDYSIEIREKINSQFEDSWLNAVLDASNLLMRQLY